MPDTGLAERVERIEAHLAIQQLAIRYAMAVDARDMDAWVGCFRPDVDMGRHGTGREALRRYIDPMVRRFYRSVHQICGHRIELTTKDTATGAVYCRAEHEAGDEWIVMAICYFDEYARVDGEWFFSRRRERHWYAADVTGHARNQRDSPAGRAAGSRRCPASSSSWARFWDGDPRAATLTTAPAPAERPGEGRRLVRPAQSARLAAGPGPAGRLHPGAVRGGRTPRRGLAVVLRAPRLRGRLPAAAADLRGGRGRADHPGPAGHRHPGRAAAQDRAARRGGGGGGHHQRRPAGAGPGRRLPGAGVRAVRHGLHRPVPDPGSAGRRAAPAVGATAASPRRQYSNGCRSGWATRGRRAPGGRDGWARGCSPWPPVPGRPTGTAWPRAATTRPPPGWPAGCRRT